jgi:hypothetical protein
MSESIRALCLKVVDEVVADVLGPLPSGIPGLSDVAVLVELGLPVDEVSQRFAFALSLDHSLSRVLLVIITLIFALLVLALLF